MERFGIPDRARSSHQKVFQLQMLTPTSEAETLLDIALQHMLDHTVYNYSKI